MFPKNVAASIDRQRTNINCYVVAVDFDPGPLLFSRTVNAASTSDKISPCEDVTLVTDRKCSDVKRKQPLFDRLPSLGAIT
jgi:hypothetical protein